MTTLPRQARDKHRKRKQVELRQKGRFSQASRRGGSVCCSSVRKTHLSRHFTLKLIILQRQARDKHRESTQKEMRWSQATQRSRLRWPRGGQSASVSSSITRSTHSLRCHSSRDVCCASRSAQRPSESISAEQACSSLCHHAPGRERKQTREQTREQTTVESRLQ